MGKFVKNALFVVYDVTIFYRAISRAQTGAHYNYFSLLTIILADGQRQLMSEIYIEYPPKWICLWNLISTKETTHVFTHKTRFPNLFRKFYFTFHACQKGKQES